jgi:hypothetical protein
MFANAVFSPDRVYRYSLRRVWDSSQPLAMFVGLNPSTADETHDDPTIRRIVGFARGWGYGGVIVVNLFAYCATNPRQLRRVPDPVGPENDEWIIHCQAEAALVVAAWGNEGTYLARAGEVLPLLHAPHALAVTQTGQPAHPLFLPGDLIPAKYSILSSPKMIKG